jgi:hypothetical protein
LTSTSDTNITTRWNSQTVHAFLQRQRPWQLACDGMGSQFDQGRPSGGDLRQFVG